MKNETKQIKEEVNKIINAFVHRPWTVYVKYITKNKIDIVYIEGGEAIRLSCHIWQDNYFNKPVQRARLDIDNYTTGKSMYISSQCSWEGKDDNIQFKPDNEYLLIEKVINSFNQINDYYERMKQLAKESADISPGSPRSRLNHEFYNKEWEI